VGGDDRVNRRLGVAGVKLSTLARASSAYSWFPSVGTFSLLEGAAHTGGQAACCVGDGVVGDDVWWCSRLSWRMGWRWRRCWKLSWRRC
jgi:hypothetical protein